MKKLSYKSTRYASYIAYVTQAMIGIYVPLLFVTFQDSYGISLAEITTMVTLNFFLQLLVDWAAALYADRVGYRICSVAAHILAAAGLAGLTILPEMMPTPFLGLLCAGMVYSVGGGLLEVLISPIIEACPSDNKESAMSLLHSFYCWGGVAVVLGSTLFFLAFGTGSWKILTFLWALIPLSNAFLFSRVPLASLHQEGEQGLTIRELMKNRMFWILALMMVCAGASEQSVAQWASAFAERGLGVSKAVGDLAGPMMFAALMGTARLLYSRFGEKIDLRKAIMACGVLCLGSYLLISLSPFPALGLVGCGLCGFSVGIFWPGTFSISAVKIRRGGTAMFALLALGGDVGCCAGPALVGSISSVLGDNLAAGILAGTVFPLVLLGGMMAQKAAEQAEDQAGCKDTSGKAGKEMIQ